MSRLIGYVRATPEEGSLERQIAEVRAAGCGQVYSDPLPGPQESMGEFDDCLEQLAPGDTLVVSRVETLASTLAELADVLAILEKQSVELSICNWHPAPKMSPAELRAVVRHLIDFESAAHSVRVRTGLVAARAKGRVGGRRRLLTTEQVQALREAMAQPNSNPIEVGKRFGLARATVYRYLKRRGGEE